MLWAALVVPSEVAAAEVEAGADESAAEEAAEEAAEVAAEEAAEEEPAALALQAAAAADWALARSEALHFSIRHGATRPASWAWVDVLHWQAVSVRAQPALGMASLRQGTWEDARVSRAIQSVLCRQRERIGLLFRSQSLLFTSTYSAVRLAGKVLGSDQACEEEGDDRGLHCEDFCLFCFRWCCFEIDPAGTTKSE